MNIIAWLLLILVFCGCTRPDNNQPFGYVSKGDDRWLSSTISVCFEQDGFESSKENVARAVADEYRKAGLELVGWDRCGKAPVDLFVYFDNYEASSRVEAFGKQLQGMRRGIRLGRAHECFQPFAGSHCEANVAVHEFGHALGLHHEMNRRDNPDCRFEQAWELGEDEAVQIGDYDADSIMNYCSLFTANRTNRHLGLSAGDIATLQSRYTQPMADLVDVLPYWLESDRPLQVRGYRVTQYRYKAGLLATTDCKVEAGYSDAIDSVTEIPASVLEALPMQRNLRLCLLGGDAEGSWQPWDRYTAHDFVRVGDGTSLPQVVGLEWAPGPDASQMRLDIHLAEPFVPNDVKTELVYESGGKASKNHSKVIVSADEKTLSVFHNMTNLPHKGRVYLRKFVLTNSRDIPLEVVVKAEDSTWGTSGLPLPRYDVPGFDASLPPLTLQKIVRISPVVSDSPKIYFEIEMSHDLPFDLMFLTFKEEQSQRTRLLFVPDVFPLGQGRYRIAADKEPYFYNGTYHLDAISYQDVFGAVHEGRGPVENQAVFAVADDVPADTRGPELTSIALPSVINPQTQETIEASLGIDHTIPIEMITMTFKGQKPDNEEEIYLDYYGVLHEEQTSDFLLKNYVFPSMPDDAYRLATLSIKDKAGNRLEWVIEPGDTVLPGTSLPIPVVTLFSR